MIWPWRARSAPHLPRSASDEEILAFVAKWVSLLESEDYAGAFAMTAHAAHMGWTPDLMRQVIKGYGEADSRQRVTLRGAPTDRVHTTEVTRWAKPRHGAIAWISYDLYIDGLASDLTATFRVLAGRKGLVVELDDIHVM